MNNQDLSQFCSLLQVFFEPMECFTKEERKEKEKQGWDAEDKGTEFQAICHMCMAVTVSSAQDLPHDRSPLL